jgi:BirA family biotin operon repressor/biotin-[acetyl-CoA-carboxylase] ligase
MDQSVLERELAGLFLAEIRYYESLDSTNDTAAAWVASGAPDYSLVVANQQRRGRGRAGRSWLTVPGASLAFSLVLRPTSRECGQAESLLSRFSGLGAVGVRQVLRSCYGLPACIKWPNDVLVKDKKICGVLAEADWIGDQPTAVILGIGINIATSAVPPASALRLKATSLQAESGSFPDRSAVLRQILTEIMRWRTLLMEPIFLQTWQDHLAYLGDWVQLTATDQAGQTGAVLAQGQLVGLGPGGELRLRTQAGVEKSFRMGEIHPAATGGPQGQFPRTGVEIQLRPVDSLPKSAKLTARNKK